MTDTSSSGHEQKSPARPGMADGGISAQVLTGDGWPITYPVLTVTDMCGHQVARVVGDGQGSATTESLHSGTYTVIVTAPGFEPAARMTVVSTSGVSALGVIPLERSGNDAPPIPGTWTIDPLHSTINLTAHHLGIGGIRGRFTEFHGQIQITDPFERSRVHTEIKAASIDTGNATRDQHLRSADFLDVEAHPTIEYQSTYLTPRAGQEWAVHGQLALRGVSQSVDLELSYLGLTDDPWGGTRAGFTATTSLRRHDFEIAFDQRLLSGIAQIGSTVRIELDVQAVHGETLPWETLGLR